MTVGSLESPRPPKSLRVRLIVGTLLIAMLVGLFVADGLLGSRALVSALVFVLGIAGWLELAAMSGLGSRDRGGGLELGLLGLLATAYFLGLGWWEARGGSASRGALEVGLFALVAGAFACVVFRADFERGFQPLLVTVMGALLFGFLFSFLFRIYHAPEGALRGIVFAFGVKGNDIAAYLCGRRFGRVRFLKVSPKKTLEGCAAALLFSAVWFPAAALLWPGIFFDWPRAIGLGIILSIATQVGDFSESLIKRCYQVKDSSTLLPEFGGVLDLIDSFIFSGYVFWAAGVAPALPG